MGPGGREVQPETAPETPWRALLESRSLAKGVIHSRRTAWALPGTQPKRWRPLAGSLHRSTDFAYPHPSKRTPTDS